jgi:hypothetical protein
VRNDCFGKVFYKLKVIDKIEIYRGKFQWVCLCECGNQIICHGSDLKKGYKKSCGCWRKPKEIFITDEERFWSFVHKSENCWIWTGSKTTCGGYGQISLKGKPFRANRYSWILHNGSIPKGLMVCHRCDNPACVNPYHLFLGDQTKNMQDMISKKRQNIARGSRKSFSKLTDDKIKMIRNLYKNPFSSKELSTQFCVSKQNILDIVNRKAWKHVE